MYIRSARCYDLKTKSIVFGNNQPCTVENQKAAHGGEGKYCELLYEFCHNMAAFKTDNSEYTLFTAICIFSGIGLSLISKYTFVFVTSVYIWVWLKEKLDVTKFLPVQSGNGKVTIMLGCKELIARQLFIDLFDSQ